MPTNHPFDFEYSYLSLPDTFYSLVKPGSFPSPEIFLLNNTLCDELNVSKDQKDWIDYLANCGYRVIVCLGKTDAINQTQQLRIEQ